MLDIKTRQKYLLTLGYKLGSADGIEGAKTKAAYRSFQKDNKLLITGSYNQATDKKLIDRYNEYYDTYWKKSKYFKKNEFKCGCNKKYCDGFPADISPLLVKNLNKVRTKFGKPVTITCGLRCKDYNASLKGSVSNSGHIIGTAADIYIPGITDTEEGRLKVILYWMSLTGSKFSYAYLPNKYRTQLEKKSTNMGNAVHVETF